MKISLFHFLLIFVLISSSCKSSKPIADDEEPLPYFNRLFKTFRKKPVVIKIRRDTFIPPVGGHIQGIQQLNKNHLIISGSSDNKAYFFVAEMKGVLKVKRRGTIKQLIYINDDFPGMLHNHASGIQLDGNLLAIGTEGGNDEHKSSVIFYDLTNPENPKPLSTRINRQEDTAGSIGLTSIGDSTLLAVGGWDSDRIDFYLSKTSNRSTSKPDFKLWKTWHTNSKNIQNWIDPFWGTYQSLNFLKGENDALALIGFFQNEYKAMVADLYQIDFDLPFPILLKKIDTKIFQTEEGVSFKNGAGLSILNMPKRINILATERDWNKLIRINYW